MKVTIKVTRNGEEILTKVLGEGVFRAGRSDFSDVVLDDEAVSRSHLELRVTESSLYITNMTSVGRTKLNGEFMETGEAKDGDEIAIGPFTLSIYFGEVGAEAGGIDNPLGDLQSPPVDDAGVNPLEPPPDSGEPAAPADAPADDNVIPFPDAGGGGRSAALLEDMPLAEGSAALARHETQIEIKPVVAKLIFTTGPRKGDELFVEAFEVTIGRSKKADIFLDDEKLSRIHAKITRVGMGFRLIDLNSRNGTFVNGVRILEHPLGSFDEIEIGHSKMKFLIHDMMSNDINKGSPGQGKGMVALEQTKSVMLGAEEEQVLRALEQPAGPTHMSPPQKPAAPRSLQDKLRNIDFKKLDRRVYLWGGVAVLLLAVLLMPSGGDKTEVDPAAKVGQSTTGAGKLDAKPLSALPKEYSELSPEMQRQIEGNYNLAIRSAEKEQFEKAVAALKKVHEFVPYYKQSLELMQQYGKRVKEREIIAAQERAKRDEKADLQIYLEEGLEYLKQGDFGRASEAFHSAINIDPNNQIAAKGLKAVEQKVTDLDKVKPDRDPEEDKKKEVADLFEKAVAAFYNKSYQEAIDSAEKIRKIEVKGDPEYLNKAKQIIDRAKMMQKELFEPFLLQAKEKYTEGDYNSSRDLCEEMLKQDPAYDDAKECLAKARNQLNRLAKEAYTHGYILESMNRIEEAKQYWNRAKNYVRPGDNYFDKVTKKLEYYQ